jgi:hypothetical protein
MLRWLFSARPTPAPLPPPALPAPPTRRLSTERLTLDFPASWLPDTTATVLTLTDPEDQFWVLQLSAGPAADPGLDLATELPEEAARHPGARLLRLGAQPALYCAEEVDGFVLHTWRFGAGATRVLATLTVCPLASARALAAVEPVLGTLQLR